MDINQQIKNILAIYAEATPEEITAGMKWYTTANEIVKYLAEKYHKPECTVTGVLAALSPGTDWHQNIIDTVFILKMGEKAIVSTYGQNKRKALKILGMSDEDEIFTILLHKSKINKTSQFFINILYPALGSIVTVGRHIVRVAYDEILNEQIYLTPNRYLSIQNAYYRCAQVEGMRANQLQAITWLTFRRLFEIPDKNKAIRLDDYIQEKLGKSNDVPF
jgi:hypothetical protein